MTTETEHTSHGPVDTVKIDPREAVREKALKDAIRVFVTIEKCRDEWAILSNKFDDLGDCSLNPTILEAVHKTYSKLLSGCTGDMHIVYDWLREYENLPEVEEVWKDEF